MPHNPPPANSTMGALLRYVIGGNLENYQPSGIHFGLFDHYLFNGVAGNCLVQDAFLGIAFDVIRAWGAKPPKC